MKFVDRRNTYADKWDGLKERYGSDDLIPMWVADMDFECAPCITEALVKYVSNPLGYFLTPDSYYDAVIRWEKEHHGFDVKKEWISVAPSVLPAIYWAIDAFLEPGDAVIVNNPVYYNFKDAIAAGGCRCIESELVDTGRSYMIDYEQFEKDITDNDVKMYILCNPHNPIGRVWAEDELRKVMEICRRHNVLVISDEIYQDLINPNLGRKKVTTAAIDDGAYQDIIITMSSVSKSFNLGAAQNAFIIISNPEIKAKFDEYLERHMLDDVNGFGHVATIAAFSGGEEWLKDVNETIFGNYQYIRNRFDAELPEVRVFDLEGTSVPWIDFGAFVNNYEELLDLLQKRCRIAVYYGQAFGGDAYGTFARFNIATKRELIEEACDRIIAELKK